LGDVTNITIRYKSRLTFKPDTTFPPDLPVPEDDGLYNHLTDFKIPADINLPVASDPSKKKVNLAELKELTVVFCYPRTGRASLTHLLGPFQRLQLDGMVESC
jgi:hypothetical protein